MRVAFVVGTFPELSTGVILDQVLGLLDRGHDVHVFGRKPAAGEVLPAAFHDRELPRRTHYWGDDPDIVRVTMDRTVRLFRRNARRYVPRAVGAFAAVRFGSSALSGRFWAYSAAMLGEGPFDVVFAAFGTNGRIAEQLRDIGAFDAPIATSWLGYDLTRKVREEGAGYYERLFRNGDLMLPLSENFRRRLLELGCPESKLRVLRVGVDPARFAFETRTAPRDGVLRIITVCRLVEKKGLLFALRALARAAAEGVAFRYDLIGDGPLRAELENARDQLGLTRSVVLHGKKARSEVAHLLRESHVFLSPSVTAKNGDEEGTPVAIMEAMATGLPVVSTVHSGIPELIEDGVSGFTVPEWDVDALAARIVELGRNPERWEALGRSGRRVVESRYDQNRLNDELADVLSDLAARGRG